MSVRRLIVAAVLGAFLVIDTGTGAFAVDPAFPTGTFGLNSTSVYISYNPIGDDPPRAFPKITRTALGDDPTAARDIVVTLFNGDGSPGQVWPHDAGYWPATYYFW